jgi:hypothetical protein
VQRVLYNEWSGTRRAHVHVRAGEVLEESGASPAVLAAHFVTALPVGDSHRAAVHSAAAGRAALEGLAFEEAVEHLTRAVKLVADAESSREVGEWHAALGRALDDVGRREEARRAYLAAAAVARACDDGTLLADVALACAGPLPSHPDPTQITAQLLDEALALLDPADVRRRVLLLDRRSATLAFGHETEMQRAVTAEAVRLGRSTDDPESLVAALFAERRSLRDPARTVDRLELAREAASVADAAGMEWWRIRARREMLSYLLTLGDVDEFEELRDEYASIAAAARRPGDVWWAEALRATRALMIAPDERAEHLIASAEAIGSAFGHEEVAGTALIQRFTRAVECGPRELGEWAVSQVQARKDAPRYPSGRALDVFLRARLGDRDGANRGLDELLAGDFAVFPVDTFLVMSLALCAGAAATMQRRDAGARLFELLEPYSALIVVAGAGGAVLGPVEHWLGVLAGALDRPDAEAHLKRAIRESQRCGAPYWVGAARWELDRLRLG